MIEIMVVEKDPSLAWLYKEELEEAGFGVRVVHDSERALYELRSRPVHVLVTDDASINGGWESWVGKVRDCHQGDLVVLFSERLPRASGKRGLQLLPKSSNLEPLIRSLKSQSLKFLWHQATANC
ncbi:MAG: hypothetical protein KQJ78_08950 [Deltaproteobacteria bacterium]|nr:hypothetical protein [Deltaproteobacteria bacterium]